MRPSLRHDNNILERKHFSVCRVSWIILIVFVSSHHVSLGESASNKPKSSSQPPIHPSPSSSSSNPSDPNKTEKSKSPAESGRSPGSEVDGNGGSSGNNKSPGQVISLAESINRSTKLYLFPDPERAKASKEQWERALQEIKNLSNPSFTTTKSAKAAKTTTTPSITTSSESSVSTTSSDGTVVVKNEDTVTKMKSDGKLESKTKDKTSSKSYKRIFSQWRSTPSDNIPRFEGFANWERILQDWADDVQEYMDKIESENTGEGYPMSTYGRVVDSTSSSSPSISTSGDESKDVLRKEKGKDELIDGENYSNQNNAVQPTSDVNHKSIPKRRKSSVSLPIPAPAKEGEAVVPHTDISDKSKRIWITTTAALPWMTGTAVNPLLRAAYMTEGRDEAGGSVTLMIPWLERRQDQEQVYGSQKLFETPAEQEQYIRTWLRDTANLPSASEKLGIEWYTAWQNKAENSIYSMGDITALIPDDKVDIMILEEPEHLNWYVEIDTNCCLELVPFRLHRSLF
jgi:hypothetical protein